MQSKKSRPDNNSKRTPEKNRKKLLLPNQLDLIMEDGTICHVRSFFADKGQMGEVLDALSLEKIDRAK